MILKDYIIVEIYINAIILFIYKINIECISPNKLFYNFHTLVYFQFLD